MLPFATAYAIAAPADLDVSAEAFPGIAAPDVGSKPSTLPSACTSPNHPDRTSPPPITYSQFEFFGVASGHASPWSGVCGVSPCTVNTVDVASLPPLHVGSSLPSRSL